jgi:alkylhydroperoxidase/carboxymuconolactone decarboxylase family protein YurZ
VLLVFFSFPNRVDSNWAFVVSVLLMIAGTAVLGWAITSQVRRHLAGDADDLQSLVTLLALVLLVFTLGFYALERTNPGQIAGLHTRIDALYFTLATMGTVGYGDVHASGQVARVIVSTQMIFNIVFVGTLASVVTRRVRIRALERDIARRTTSPEGDASPDSQVPDAPALPGSTAVGTAMPTVHAVVVDETKNLLTALSLGDATMLAPTAERVSRWGDLGLEPRTSALLRFGSAVALGAPEATSRQEVAAAVRAGASAEDLLDVLRTVAPAVGVPKVVAAAAYVVNALDLRPPEQPQVLLPDEGSSHRPLTRSPE